MKKLYKVGIYCRLSVDDASNSAKAKNYIPADESVSIENQYELLSKFVMLNGWTEVKSYRDDGYSGGNFQRPGFLEMLEDARHGLINLILVKDLSRLGRDFVEVGRYTDVIFPSLGCRFVSVLDCLDTEGDNTDIEIRLEAAVPDLRLFGEQIGKDVEHQLLRLVNVMQIAVNIQGQGVAIFFHQGLQPRVVAAQILAVQALVADHIVHFLFADAKMQMGIRQVLVLSESRRCPLKRGSEGFSASSGIAHERPNRDAPGIRPSAQYWLTRRSDTPQR